MQVIVSSDGFFPGRSVWVAKEASLESLSRCIAESLGIFGEARYERWKAATLMTTFGGLALCDDEEVCPFVRVVSRGRGGIDFQNRAGSKPGSGGVQSSEQAAVDRRERLRKLALESIDLNKDPYFMRNHLGTFECKLCLTLHNTESNYLAHTQGKRHQQNLARRAFREASLSAPIAPQEPTAYVEKRHTIKIGRPGYKVTKSRDLKTKQRTLLFELDYPEATDDLQPRHRFMSAFEQRIEPPDKNFQYLLFACEPYETVGFKIPNSDVDKDPSRFFSNWDAPSKKFSLTLQFKDHSATAPQATAAAGAQHRPTLRYDGRI